MNQRNLIVYISASLDGFISKPNDDLSFLNAVQVEGEDYGYEAFIDSVDTVIIGKRTYDWVMNEVDEYPHKEKDTYVITRTTRPAEGKTQFYSGDLNLLVKELKSKPGKNIFCDGGSQIVNELLKIGAVDELIVSIIPVILGAGTPLFSEGIPEKKLQLISSKNFESGLLQAHYKFH
ncbi:MAG: dihydrofolate reductase family protein [Bacteroidia bacterium]